MRGESMRKSIWKGALREIGRTWNRFLAIVIIVALGVAFYTGLKAVGPDMNHTATRYFTATNMMDYKIVSNIGLNADDLAAVASQPGIGQVMAGYSLDALLMEAEESRVVHVMSLPEKDGGINSLNLVEGRLPQAANECVVDSTKRNKGLTVGTVIKLVSGTEDDLSESLATTTYTVVGTVEAPNYLNRERGSSRIGNGKVTGLVYVPFSNFSMEYYTELYATIDGSGGVPAFGAAYDALARAQDTAMEDLAAQREAARHREILDEATGKLAEKQQELDDARAEANLEIADAQAKIDAANQKLSDGTKELEDARAEAKREFADVDRELSDAESKLASGRKQYDANRRKYNEQTKQAELAFAGAQKKIESSKEQIAQQEAALATMKAQLAQGTADGTLTEEQIVALQTQIIQLEAGITQAKAQVLAAENELAAQKKQLADGKAKLDSAKRKLDASAADLEDGKKQLADAKAEAEQKFTDAEAEIAGKRVELADAQKELDDARKEADTKIADAQVQLDDARQEIADIPEPNWVVLGRDDNSGYNDFSAAISRTDGLASIFPLFFFLIAALVCLTTMTRMVDEQRTQIGTLKALGYGRGAVAFQYLFYAGSASVLGSSMGLAAGFLLLPRVIMLAYEKLYSLPDLLVMFQSMNAAMAVAMAVGATVVAALFTCWRELAGVPAMLMRPQAPKAGRRIILERIGYLWKRMSFSQKVTVRNLIRYQKRFWMTVLGVACCSALMLTGLGLKDSVATQVSDRQFGELFLYDLSFQVKDDLDRVQTAAIDDVLRQAGVTWTPLRMESATAGAGSGTEKCSLMVPMAPEELPAFLTLRDPKTAQSITLPERGAVVTEKLAEMLGVLPGSTITLTDNDDRQAKVTVSAIAENYISHFVAMSPAAYRDAFGLDAAANQRMANLPEGMAESGQQALATALTGLEGVSGVRYQQDNMADFHDIIKSLDYIVWVIILAAAALAFAVLYTLTSINISERFREIATLKVLGFFDRETAAYVFRESYILTVLGIGLGMALGVLLHGFVLNSLEVDAVMFVRQVLPQSYAISAALTLAFTWIVNCMALGKIRTINMVEALKGVE